MSGTNFSGDFIFINFFKYNYLKNFQKSLNEQMGNNWSDSFKNLEERIDAKINKMTTKLNQPIFFDFGLRDHVYTNGYDILKFDLD